MNQWDAGVPSGEEKWRPDKISAPEAREIRRGRWEGPSQTPDRRSRKGEEGVCPVHSSPVSLLGSQVRGPAL